MTHAQLVAMAAKWLAGSRKCPVVITEMASDTAETPDAIGWRFGLSTLVECKASRADFRADAAKPFRAHAALGMGAYRFFLAPAGTIAPADLAPGWGLLAPRGNGLRVVVPSHAAGCTCRGTMCSPAFRPDAVAEARLWTSLARRLAGVGVRGRASAIISPYVQDNYASTPDATAPRGGEGA